MNSLAYFILSLHLFQLVIGTLQNNRTAQYYLQETPIWNKLYNATGGCDRFVDELIKFAKQASSLRPGNPVAGFWNYTAGYNGMVGRLVSIMIFAGRPKLPYRIINQYYSVGIKYVVRFLNAIAMYCPHLPVPRIHRYSIDRDNATLCYYFMDWIEGRPFRHNFPQITTEILDSGPREVYRVL